MSSTNLMNSPIYTTSKGFAYASLCSTSLSFEISCGISLTTSSKFASSALLLHRMLNPCLTYWADASSRFDIRSLFLMKLLKETPEPFPTIAYLPTTLTLLETTMRSPGLIGTLTTVTGISLPATHSGSSTSVAGPTGVSAMHSRPSCPIIRALNAAYNPILGLYTIMSGTVFSMIELMVCTSPGKPSISICEGLFSSDFTVTSAGFPLRSSIPNLSAITGLTSTNSMPLS